MQIQLLLLPAISGGSWVVGHLSSGPRGSVCLCVVRDMPVGGPFPALHSHFVHASG